LISAQQPDLFSISKSREDSRKNKKKQQEKNKEASCFSLHYKPQASLYLLQDK
jgi:hypothetical protein